MELIVMNDIKDILNKMKFVPEHMQDEVLRNIKDKIEEEIAEDCFREHGEDLNIDHIYEEITYALHEGIKADIAYFAYKYLDDNNIPYGE